MGRSLSPELLRSWGLGSGFMLALATGLVGFLVALVAGYAGFSLRKVLVKEYQIS